MVFGECGGDRVVSAEFFAASTSNADVFVDGGDEAGECGIGFGVVCGDLYREWSVLCDAESKIMWCFG